MFRGIAICLSFQSGKLVGIILMIMQFLWNYFITFVFSLMLFHLCWSWYDITCVILEGGAEHRLVAKLEAHKRIIWACSWNPFGYEFATGSRDKSVKIWCVEDASSVKLLATLPQFRDSVTALAWMGRDRASNVGILAAGMDNGLIELWSVSGGRASSGTQLSVACVLRFDPLLCHVSTVHRLRWRCSTDEKSTLELASCGADHTVRVFEVCGSI